MNISLPLLLLLCSDSGDGIVDRWSDATQYSMEDCGSSISGDLDYGELVYINFTNTEDGQDIVFTNCESTFDTVEFVWILYLNRMNVE